MVTKQQQLKDRNVSALFLFIQLSVTEIRQVLRKTYGKLITMTGEKGGLFVLVGEL